MANIKNQTESIGQLRGHTRIWKNDELVFDHDNAIIAGTGTTSPTGLKAYLAQALGATIDRGLDDLMGTGDSDLISSAAMENKDGILIMAEADDYGASSAAVRSMVTTSITATNTFGRKWRGVLTAGGARQFGYAVLGWGAQSPEGSFQTGFAEQTFSTIVLANLDTLTIEWEIYIA